MPRGMRYAAEPSGAKPGQPGLEGNAADIRKAKAPKGSAAEKIEANMKAGERSLPTPGPNTISKVDWDRASRPSSPHANMQSRNRRTYDRVFEKDQ
jgi:hypothetical protein